MKNTHNTVASPSVTFVLFLMSFYLSCTVDDKPLLSSAPQNTTKASPANLQEILRVSPIKENINQIEEIERLKEIVPQKPTVVDDVSKIKIMRKAAETKREEALNLLIKCLAFNYDPDSSNEKLSQVELIPAIGIIEEFYGEKAGENLYKEAVSTKDKWLIDRIALAVRVILSDAKREQLNERFLVGTINSDLEYFATVLTKDDLRINFARPNEDLYKELEEKLNQIRKRNALNNANIQ